MTIAYARFLKKEERRLQGAIPVHRIMSSMMMMSEETDYGSEVEGAVSDEGHSSEIGSAQSPSGCSAIEAS